MGLTVDHISLKYGKQQILQDVSFSVREGEIVTLFGPSGVGKTTLLKLIAGVQNLKQGKIQFSGDFSQDKTILVFQDFLLFPHLTVFENIAFGLKVRHLQKAVIQAKVAAMLTQFDLGGLEKHFPNQLSGGQQQRVAMARALVVEPKLLLLDEPFASLDNHLKIRMRRYLVQLLQKYNFGVILVTHDKDEAFLLSDRIAVLLHGQIQQIGSPQAVYYQPTNRAVADLIGEMNYLKGHVNQQTFTVGTTQLKVVNSAGLSGAVTLLLPFNSEIQLSQSNADLSATVVSNTWQPNGNRIVVKIQDQTCVFYRLADTLTVGQRLHLKFLKPLQIIAS